MHDLLQQYCDETTFHGLKELFYARTNGTKIFWILVFTIGTGMTILQMHNIVQNYTNFPIKTEISLLPPNVTPKYPPIVYWPTYFHEWVDLQKVKTFNFDLGTFFYFMSYFQTMLTTYHFNVREAEQKLITIMKQQNISNIHDLAIAVSLPSPSMLLTNYNFDRFISPTEKFIYVTRVDELFYKNEVFLSSHMSHINFVATATFEHTEFYNDFIKLFNYNPITEYNWFFSSFAHRDRNITISNNIITYDSRNTMLPFWISLAADRLSFTPVDLYLFDYKFIMYGTFYNWEKTVKNPCKNELEKYYFECDLLCSQKFKLHIVYTNELYFVTNDSLQVNLNESRQQDYKVQGYVNKDFPFDSYHECIKNCTSTCKKWKFQFQKSSTFRSERLLQRPNITVGLILVQYDYDENIIIVSQALAATWNEALGNIGGLLGLWLGGSLISFVQLFYMFIFVPLETWFISRCRRLSKRKSVDLQSTEVVQNSKISEKC